MEAWLAGGVLERVDGWQRGHGPRKDRPGFLPRLRTNLKVTVVGGLGLVATTLLSGLVTGAGS